MPDPLATPNEALPSSTGRRSFRHFYAAHFLPEHQHPVNAALHIAGTVAGTAFAVGTLVSSMPWLVLLFPVVHAAPGLIGHRLFERNAAVGDVRVLRKDYPAAWFIAANHVLTFEWLRSGLVRLPKPR